MLRFPDGSPFVKRLARPANMDRREFLQTRAEDLQELGMLSRRTFVKGAATTAAMIGLNAAGVAETAVAKAAGGCGVRARNEPLAIAMWDFSWALRHDPGCEFADWDKVLDGLVERGYNAIRLDVFPALVASSPDGHVNDSHNFPQQSGWKPAMWGNQFTTMLRPRKALKEFLRAVSIAACSWDSRRGSKSRAR